jgi:hypothetical protein
VGRRKRVLPHFEERGQHIHCPPTFRNRKIWPEISRSPARSLSVGITAHTPLLAHRKRAAYFNMFKASSSVLLWWLSGTCNTRSYIMSMMKGEWSRLPSFQFVTLRMCRKYTETGGVNHWAVVWNIKTVTLSCFYFTVCVQPWKVLEFSIHWLKTDRMTFLSCIVLEVLQTFKRGLKRIETHRKKML